MAPRFAPVLTRMLGGALALMAAHAAFAAEPLAAAVRAAFAHDPLYAAAVAQAGAADAQRRQAEALWKPQAMLALGAGVAGARNEMRGAAFSAPGFPDTTGAAFSTRIDAGPYLRWALTAQQPLLDRTRDADARQLKTRAQIGDTRRELAAQDLRLRVVQAWVEVLAAEDALALLDRQKTAVDRALDEARERFDAGESPVTELREAQARRDGLGAQRLAAESELRVKRATLEDITGRPAAGLAQPTDATLEAAAPAGPLDDWLARAGSTGPMRQLFDLGESVAVDEAAKLDGRTAPTLDLVARVADDRLRGDGRYGDARVTASSQSIGLQLNVPLWNGGMRDAQRAEARAAIERVRAENADGLRLVRRQVRGAWEAVTTGAARVDALARALASARTRLDATETGREAGARTTLDVLNAQAEAFAAERAWRQARYALLAGRVTLAAAAGELDDATIERLSATMR